MNGYHLRKWLICKRIHFHFQTEIRYLSTMLSKTISNFCLIKLWSVQIAASWTVASCSFCTNFTALCFVRTVIFGLSLTALASPEIISCLRTTPKWPSRGVPGNSLPISSLISLSLWTVCHTSTGFLRIYILLSSATVRSNINLCQ